jgi:AraC family transcriptional regulator
MLSMNRVVRLLETDAVALERFDHVPGVAHRDPRREHAKTHAINLVEAGSFRVRTTGRWHTMTAGSVLVTTPGLEFSCAHDEDLPSDSCLSVRYSDDAIESARSVTMTAPASTPSLVRPLTNRQAFLQHGLLECVAGDEARLEALADALLASLSASRKKQPLFRAVRLSWYAGRVERAKAMIAARYAERLSLSMLARDAGMSIFHFARVFAELEGQPPHRYLRDVRLAHARTRLRGGAGVTETCFAVGFGSLSHFATTFRRRYGTRPSELSAPAGARSQLRRSARGTAR